MSQAWMAPVVLWKEPALGTIVRIGGRGLLAAWFTAVAVVAPQPWLRVVAAVLAFFAIAHTSLAVANRVRSRGAVLRLMGSGAVEWFPSLQEVWLRRPIDFVDGSDIEVSLEPKFPGFAFTDPRVNLRGQTSRISRLPLYAASVDRFITSVNAAAEGRGVTFYAEGTSPRFLARREAVRKSQRGTKRRDVPGAKASGTDATATGSDA